MGQKADVGEARGCGTYDPLASTRPLREVLDSCRDAAVITDLEGRIRYANQMFVEWLGAASPEGTMPFSNLLARQVLERDVIKGALAALYAHPERSDSGRVTRLGPVNRVYDWQSRPVHGAGEAPTGRCFVFHDASHALELARVKGDILSTVAHELRTPLASVRGSLQLLLRGASTLSATERELMGISLRNADRLIRLTNNVLDLSWLELGRVDLTLADIPTATLVEETVEGLRSYAAARDVVLRCEIHRDLPHIHGDRDRIIQVLTNLLSNAVKFSPRSGLVLVRAAPLPAWVTIAVRDWGAGIHAEDQVRLFQRFQRLRPSSDGEPGTGLGLAISKAIVDRHGGRILVKSAEGAGSTFTVMLPRCA